MRKRLHEIWFHYICLNNGKYLANLIDIYCKFSKTKSQKDFNDLLILLKKCAGDGSNISNEIYRYFITYDFFKIFAPIVGQSTEKEITPLDITLSCTYTLLLHWANYFDGREFNVIYDESKCLEKKKKLLTLLFDVNKRAVKKSYSKLDATYYILPEKLSVIELSFCNSSEYYALQLADLLAGAINDIGYQLSGREKDKVEDIYRLMKAIGPEGLLNMIPDISLASQQDRNFILNNQLSHLLLKK